MDEYKPNSYKSKEEAKDKPEAKKVEKVASGTVKKKSEASKLKSVFISEDAANIKDYILMDVLVPALKKALSDIVTNGIEMILYGESGVNRKRPTSSNVSYRDYYGRDSRRTVEPRRVAGYDYDDVILDTRGEAEEVLARMDELIATYGIVSVADLYDLVGVTCNYTDNKYGWTNIRNAEPVRIKEGYTLKLPKALPIN